MRLKKQSKLLFLPVALFGAACNKSPQNIFGFSSGQFPIEIAVESLRVRAEDKWLSGANKDCASCHQSAYDNWSKSRHKFAFTNELYRESHEREPSAWCLNCHAPFAVKGAQPLDLAQRLQKEAGVSCNVCHVRNNRVIVSKIPAPKKGEAAHDYILEPQISTARFCESCHEFNFPSADSKPEAGHNFRYSDVPMQATYSEWLGSGFSGTTCQQCHLYSGSNQSHRFPGGHDKQLLTQAVRLEAERNAEGKLHLRIFTVGIGHAFPTGDLFRTLRISLFAHQRPIREILLGKRFENRPAKKGNGHLANKFLVEDSTIPAPAVGDFVSMRDYLIEWPADATHVRYEMSLDFLHPHNALVSTLPRSLTRNIFQKGTIGIKKARPDNSKG